MKKILKYISLLAGVAFLTAACSQSDITATPRKRWEPCA